ncbi:MAG: hypothetical protein H6711_32285 [Myxococcales bacterium]|nr:hypothetical protein [Myxococcales bacterium]
MPKPPVVDPEIKICGAHACQAVAARRPQDVRRVYLTEELLGEFGEFLKWCARQRIAYHVVGDDDLERLTQSVHHGGVAFIVRQPPPPSMPTLLRRLGADAPGTPRLLLYLDNVQNPHNLGAIVRVAAHFGADAILVAGEGAGLSTSMVRTAEGGAEFVDVLPVALGRGPLLALREAGFRLLATSSHAQRSLYGAEGLPPRIVVMLGSESHGLAPAIRGMADATVVIPGSGQVESLNVACAAAVILGEHWREHREGASAPSASADATLPKEQAVQRDSDASSARAAAAPATEERPRGRAAARSPKAGARAPKAPERGAGEARGPPVPPGAQRPDPGPRRDRRAPVEGPPRGRRGGEGPREPPPRARGRRSPPRGPQGPPRRRRSAERRHDPQRRGEGAGPRPREAQGPEAGARGSEARRQQGVRPGEARQRRQALKSDEPAIQRIAGSRHSSERSASSRPSGPRPWAARPSPPRSAPAGTRSR